jgi:hypothetical protein
MVPGYQAQTPIQMSQPQSWGSSQCNPPPWAQPPYAVMDTKPNDHTHKGCTPR